MECIHCTQCADACDAIMDKVGKPRGLIHYTSQNTVEGKPTRFLRPRVVLYPAALAVAVGLLAFNLGTKADTDVTLLRGAGAPFTRQPNGSVVNQIRVKITNRAAVERAYRLEISGVAGASLITPRNPVTVPGDKTVETSIFVVVPETSFEDDRLPSTIRVTDGAGFSIDILFELVGPEREHDDDESPMARGPAGTAIP